MAPVFGICWQNWFGRKSHCHGLWEQRSFQEFGTKSTEPCGSLGSSSVLFMLFVSLLFAAQLREVANRIPDSPLTPAAQDNMHKSWADSAVHGHSPKPHHFNLTEREAGISSPDNSSKTLKHEARLPALECLGVNSSLFSTWRFTNVCTSLHGLMELWVLPMTCHVTPNVIPRKDRERVWDWWMPVLFLEAPRRGSCTDFPGNLLGKKKNKTE